MEQWVVWILEATSSGMQGGPWRTSQSQSLGPQEKSQPTSKTRPLASLLLY